ncbi:MAG: hypothetical protein EOO71_01790 [Myxococcaceae bacterium]|nr:MAG: hypothetical protein EOO71_01790 [Myxococcaceae bacterium]
MRINPSSFKSAFDELLPQFVPGELFEDENTDGLTPWREPAVGTYAELFSEMRRAGAAPWRLHALAQVAARCVGTAPPTERTSGVEVGHSVFVPGDLKVAGDFDVAGTLVVLGDLEVTGLLTDRGPDSSVIVLGNASVGALRTSGEVRMGGHLDGGDVVVGHYNDNSLVVGGRLKARLLIEDEHDVRAQSFDVEHHYPMETFRQGQGKGVLASLKKVLTAGALGKDASVDVTLTDTGDRSPEVLTRLAAITGFPAPYLDQKPPPLWLEFPETMRRTLGTMRKSPMDRAEAEAIAAAVAEAGGQVELKFNARAVYSEEALFAAWRQDKLFKAKK